MPPKRRGNVLASHGVRQDDPKLFPGFEVLASLADFRWIDVTEEEASGLGTNGLILSPETVIVERRRERIMGEIRQVGMEVIPLAYDAPAAVGGAFRCSHHPLVRVS